MPKIPTHTLAWSSTQATYKLYKMQNQDALPLIPESPAWFAWLDEVSSFAFLGKRGHYTARKETRKRGKDYWYAYQSQGKRLRKKYLGKTDIITLARLELLAESFSARHTRGFERRVSPTVSSASLLTKGQSEVPVVLPSPLLSFPTLLATKLHLPRSRTRLVTRTRLIERIQSGLNYPLTLISAPAGFGKTTLLTQWLGERTLPVAWLSLEPEDNDPSRFLSYLIAALQTVDSRVGITVLTLLHTLPPPPPETVLAVLINELLACGKEEMVLVLDDFHVITAEPLLQGMAFFLEHLPAHFHLVLATRVDPPFPLARMRARGQLVEVRAADLRFAGDEAQMFFQTVMELDLSTEAIATLEARTEGWVAGLQLAALSLQERTDIAGFLTDFAGTHRFILDYLSDEVLERQRLPVQTFLLHTSILGQLSGPLCDAVTKQEGSQMMLEWLEKANLFVVALDEEREWYRYHHLFADVLRHYLHLRAPGLVSELHRRASSWYEKHDLPIEAVQHALAIPDAERAVRLIESLAFPLAFRRQLTTVFTWIKALPEMLVNTRPLLCVYFAILLLLTNQFEKVEIYLQKAERRLQCANPVEQTETIQGYIYAIRATLLNFSGESAHAIPLAHQALDFLPEAEDIPRAGALQITAHVFPMRGDVTEASEHAIEKTVALLRLANNPFATASGIALLARVRAMQGRLQQAAATYEQLLQIIPYPEVLQIFYIGHYFYFGLGSLFYEWNDLETAEHYLMQGLALVNENIPLSAWVAFVGYTSLARLQSTTGNISAARTTLDTLLQLAHKRHFAPRLLSQVAAEQAHLELAHGNIEAALSWAATCGLSLNDTDVPYTREYEYLVLIRVQITKARLKCRGSFLYIVSHLLERLYHEAKANARQDSVLHILVLRALVMDVREQREEALETLKQALILAEPEGYIRLFVDEGLPMQKLLQLTKARGALATYVASLLHAFEESQFPQESSPPTPPERLVEQLLTERERDVLQLLVEGASNQEIAHDLVIVLPTVKRHLTHIFAKLGVKNRVQAIRQAQKLGLCAQVGETFTTRMY